MARKRRQRREKGSGSLYRLPSGRWQAAIAINGRMVRRNAPDEAAGQVALEELRRLKAARVDIGDAAQSLDSWFDVWITLMQRELKPATLAGYRQQIDGYLRPLLGEIALNAVRPHHIQDALHQIMDGIKAHRGLPGTRTARLCALRLRQVFALAVERQLIKDSPMVGVRIPKDKARPVTPLTVAQVGAVLDAAGDDPLWHCYALLGLRRGEAIGLRWADLDLDAGTMRIVQAVQEIGGARHIGTPKTDAGARTLPLPPQLLGLLRRHRAAQRERRIKRADTYTDHDLVCCGADGGPLWPTNVDRAWHRLRRRAGIPDGVKLHHLRHTVATLLDESGATERVKQEILGHAPETVTQHYTTARIEAMRRALGQVEQAVLRRAG